MKRRLRATPFIGAAVAALGIGMALVAGGVRAGPVFMPGVFVLCLGFVVAAAAGLISLTQSDDDAADA